MQQPPTKVIDGIEYQSQPHLAEQGLYYFAILAKLLTEPLASALISIVSSSDGGSLLDRLLDGGVDEVLDKDVDLTSVARELLSSLPTALRNLSEKLEPREYVKLVKDFLSQTMVKGKGTAPVSSVFNTHFAGKMLHLHKVVAFALEVNYGDFLSAARDSGPDDEQQKIAALQ